MDVMFKNSIIKCIIAAIDLEFLAITKQFNVNKEHIYVLNDKYTIAESEDSNVVIAQAGIGKTNAKECAEALLEHYPNICGFLSVGLAGALTEQLKIGDIVIGEKVIDKEDDNYKTLDFINITMLSATEKFNVTYGPILCSDVFIKETETKDYLFHEYGTLCVEMESSGVVNYSLEKSLSILIIKVISDYANEKSVVSFWRSYKTACNSLAYYIYTIINSVFYKSR